MVPMRRMLGASWRRLTAIFLVASFSPNLSRRDKHVATVLVRAEALSTSTAASEHFQRPGPSGDAPPDVCATKCVSPKLCLAGSCRCPVLLTGPRCESTVTVPAPGGWRPLLPFQDATFGDAANKSWQSVRRLTRKGQVLGAIGDDIDFTRCAVVGSGSSLLKKAMGRHIDAHTAVIRMNEAPSHARSKHAAFTGVKTSLRLQNGQRCGYSDGGEFCLGFGPGIACDRWIRSKCNRLETPDWLEHFMTDYWHKNSPPSKMLSKEKGYDGRFRRLSGGFSAIMLALSLCAEVDIYGFLRGGGNHYYLKRLATKSPGCGGEPQDGKLMETMSARPRIQNTTTYAKSQKPARHCSKAKPWFLKHFFAVEDFVLNLLRDHKVDGVRTFN